MRITTCPHAHTPTCCHPGCTQPAVYAGLEHVARHLVEHHRCAQHTEGLGRVWQWDPRWKAVAG
jgi:hypothetical protein